MALLINVPVGALVVIAIGHLVAETHPKRANLDSIGALTATLGSGALLYGFISAADTGWTAAETLVSFVLAIGLFAQFFSGQSGAIPHPCSTSACCRTGPASPR